MERRPADVQPGDDAEDTDRFLPGLHRPMVATSVTGERAHDSLVGRRERLACRVWRNTRTSSGTSRPWRARRGSATGCSSSSRAGRRPRRGRGGRGDRHLQRAARSHAGRAGPAAGRAGARLRARARAPLRRRPERPQSRARTLPEAPSLAAAAGTLDLVVCQNVLEHLARPRRGDGRDGRAALRPGGWLVLLVPAHPRAVQRARPRATGTAGATTRPLVRALVAGAGLELTELYSFNLLGVPGWWVAGKRADPSRSSARSLDAYEALLRAWRPIERRVRPPVGLSLVASTRRRP